MMTETALNDDVLAILLTRRWIGNQIVKQAATLDLPKPHVGFEMVARGIALLMPAVTVEQARDILGTFLTQLAAGLQPAPEVAKADLSDKVVALRRPDRPSPSQTSSGDPNDAVESQS